MKTFRQWLLEQRKRNDPIGDLARDVRIPPRDEPKGNAGYFQWEGYLLDHGACEGALKALDRAYTHYMVEKCEEVKKTRDGEE